MTNLNLHLKGILLLFISVSGFGVAIAQIDTIRYSGSSDEFINIVVLGDGYTQANHDAGKFITDAQDFSDQLFTALPFKEYQNFFNVFAIPKVSNEEGANHPGTATDVAEPKSPIKDVDNYYGSSFDHNNIHRLLVPGNYGLIYSDLSNDFPNWDQVVILVNDTEYGGSGGSFATTSMHPSAGKIAIHEIGHSFANLRDEYYAGDYYAREGINMTRETDPEQVIWKNWYGDAGVGIYQHCCGGQSSDWYRPHQNCRMRSISKNFCGVCSEAIIDKIYNLTHPILDSIPVQNTVPVVTNEGILFGGEFIYPTPDSFNMEWILNDEIVVGKDNAFEYFEREDFNLAENSLVLKITDTTYLSRSYWPYAGYDYKITWNVIVESCPDNLELSMEHVGNESYIADQTIISESQVLEESTMYQAGISITLEEAFEVKNGAVFQVVIEGCN